jgi:N-acetyl-gamma-glutamylphosphate reductase
MSVNKRLIDVSGQLITDEKLRSIPQRSTRINAGTTIRHLPYKASIAALSHSLATEIKDNRFNVCDVSAATRYKIQAPSFDYRKQYGFGKDQLLKDLYGLEPIA